MPCSGRGVCADGDGDGRCACEPGWAGDDCSVCAPGFEGPSCEACLPGHFGPSCESCAGFPDSICGGRGICDEGLEGSGTCRCEPGLAGPTCADCGNGSFTDRAFASIAVSLASSATLPPDALAGPFAVAGWNNIDPGVAGFRNRFLTNFLGSSTEVNLIEFGGSPGEAAQPPADGPDGDLLAEGLAAGGGGAYATLFGLSSHFTDGYDLYLFVGSTTGENADFELSISPGSESRTGLALPNSMGAWVEASPGVPGHFVAVRGLSGDRLDIQLEGAGAYLAGFQLYRPPSATCLPCPGGLATPCSNRGACADGAGDGTCACAPGFAGEACETCAPGYFGEDCEPCPGGAENPCFGNGTCDDGLTGTGRCDCVPGRSGEDCGACGNGSFGESEAPGGDDCEACPGGVENPCGGDGVCDDGAGDGSCECFEGFAGEACEICAPGRYGPACAETCPGPPAMPCNLRGTCDDGREGEGDCRCEENWVGDACDACAPGHFGPGCEPCPGGAENPCNGSGVCDDGLLGEGRCACVDGRAGEACDSCAEGTYLVPRFKAISFNFTRGAGSLAPQDTAGLVAAASWNEIDPTDLALRDGYVDHTGAAVGLFMFGPRGDGSGAANAGAATDTPDERMMGDGMTPLPRSPFSSQVRFSELAAEFPNGYDVTVYVRSTTAAEASGIVLRLGDASPPTTSFNASFTPLGAFSGTFVEGSASASGHALTLRGARGDEFSLEIVGGQNAFVAGVQFYEPPGFVCVPCPGGADDPCGGRGVCNDGLGDGTCTCDEGWAGEVCDACAPGFFGPDCAETCPTHNGEVCGGVGSCDDGIDGEGRCECSAGFEGDACEACSTGAFPVVVDAVATCQPCPGGVDTPCNGNGVCADVTGDGSCSCDERWAGDACERCAPGYFGAGCAEVCRAGGPDAPCSGHGTCNDGLEGNGFCFCDEGWNGADCDFCQFDHYGPDCLPCPGLPGSVCSGKGSCDDGIEGQGGCTCATGYAQPDCASCERGFDGPSCDQCAEGFLRRGPVDCAECPGGADDPCSGGGACVAGAFGPECECEAGRTGAACELCEPGHFGDNCEPCPGGADNPCNGLGICSEGRDGTGECACEPGIGGIACLGCGNGTFDGTLHRVASLNFSSDPDTLFSEEAAGVLERSRWNSILLPSPALSNPIVTSDPETTQIVLAETPQGLESSFAVSIGADPNERVMRRGLGPSGGNPATVRLRNLETYFTSGYDLYLYFRSSAVEPSVTWEVNGRSIELTGRPDFDGTYVEDAPGVPGHYVVVSGLTEPEITIRTASEGTLSLTALQISGELPTCLLCPGGLDNICNGNGVCEDGSGSGQCVCDSPWTGVLCDECIEGAFGADCEACPGGYGNACNGDGVCDDGLGGSGVCTCDPSFDGDACEACAAGYYGPICFPCPGNRDGACSGRGVCDDGRDGSGRCTCDLGSAGDTCESCGNGSYTVFEGRRLLSLNLGTDDASLIDTDDPAGAVSPADGWQAGDHVSAAAPIPVPVWIPRQGVVDLGITAQVTADASLPVDPATVGRGDAALRATGVSVVGSDRTLRVTLSGVGALFANTYNLFAYLAGDPVVVQVEPLQPVELTPIPITGDYALFPSLGGEGNWYQSFLLREDSVTLEITPTEVNGVAVLLGLQLVDSRSEEVCASCPGTPEAPCSGRGTCVSIEDGGPCQCDPGYAGEDCSECAAGFVPSGDGACESQQ